MTEKPAAESTQAPAESSVASVATEFASGTDVDQDAWKQEYDEQVKVWRAQSAEAREKAEKIREEWEAKRAAEREEAVKRKVSGVSEPAPEVIPGPPVQSKKEASVVEKVAVEAKPAEGSIKSPNPADARDLVTGESQGHVGFFPSSLLCSLSERIDNHCSVLVRQYLNQTHWTVLKSGKKSTH